MTAWITLFGRSSLLRCGSREGNYIEMKEKKYFVLASLLFALLLTLFILVTEHRTQLEQRKAIETYADVVASSLWNFESQAPEDYLNVVVEQQNYCQVRIYTAENEVFVSVTANARSRLEEILISLRVLPCQEISAPIEHGTQTIGRLTARWCNRNIYNYGYTALVLILLLVSGWFYLENLHAKQHLESRVAQRTAELHNSNRALRESEQLYRTVFESSRLGMYRTTPSGEILLANPALVRMLGFSSQKELLQYNLEADWYAPDYPRSEFKERMSEEGQVIDWQSIWTRADGSKISVSESAQAIYAEDGEILYYEGQARDITEYERLLTEIERRNLQLQTAAEVSRVASTILEPDKLIERAVELIRTHFDFYYVGLFLVDKSGEYAVLRAGTGEAGKKMLAAGHKLEVGGDSMIGWCVEHGKNHIAKDVGKEAHHFDNPWLPETHSEMALPLLSRDLWCVGAVTVQSLHPAAFSVTDVAALQGMVDQLTIALENAWLHDRVRRHADELEERVAERTAELMAVNKELESFSYSVSHDLRAPLRSIDGFSQVLLEDYLEQLDAVGQDYLHRVRAAAQRMGQLITDLLRLSRTTRVEMRRSAINLSELAQQIKADLLLLAPEREVEFIIQPDLVAYCDGRLLQSALENLLSNAWKFTAKHERARIEFGMREKDDEQVYFVRDDGAGFDMAYADKLFGAFRRLHKVTEFKGIGVGLATVKRIVHRHGGRVWAEGAVEEGATFYFTLAPRESILRAEK